MPAATGPEQIEGPAPLSKANSCEMPSSNASDQSANGMLMDEPATNLNDQAVESAQPLAAAESADSSAGANDSSATAPAPTGGWHAFVDTMLQHALCDLALEQLNQKQCPAAVGFGLKGIVYNLTRMAYVPSTATAQVRSCLLVGCSLCHKTTQCMLLSHAWCHSHMCPCLWESHHARAFEAAGDP